MLAPISRNARTVAALLPLLFAMLCVEGRAFAGIIEGSVMATPEAAAENPANSGFLDRTQVSYNPTLFQSESYMIRYPGFESSAQGESGIVAPIAIPRLVVKLGPNFGIGGIVAPPGLSLPFELKKIPVILLNTLNYFDIKGEATVSGFVNLFGGYRITPTFGVGLAFDYGGAQFKADITPSSGGDPLVNVTGSASVLNVVAGLRWDLSPGKLALGLAAGVVSSTSTDIKIDSPLLSGVGGAAGAAPPSDQGGKPVSSTNPLSKVIFGAQFALSQKIKLLADGIFTRADKGQEMFSLTDLKQKPRDVHDTMGVKGDLLINLGDGRLLSVRGEYQPASIGKGGRGDGSLSGFSTIDVVMTKAPVIGQELKPLLVLGGGAQFGFMPKLVREPGKKKPSAYYALSVATGIIYKRASLGIDENGELPGAYLRTQTEVPVDITYKF